MRKGWAVYAEHLGAEHGLLDDPLQRLGWVLWDQVRSARVLQDSRYFVACLWCGRRTHRGHLAANGVYSGCQEYFFGVRY